MGRHPVGPKEIDRLLVPPGKASTLLADRLLLATIKLTVKGGRVGWAVTHCGLKK